jgi:hypothetical protein
MKFISAKTILSNQIKAITGFMDAFDRVQVLCTKDDAEIISSHAPALNSCINRSPMPALMLVETIALLPNERAPERGTQRPAMLPQPPGMSVGPVELLPNRISPCHHREADVSNTFRGDGSLEARQVRWLPSDVRAPSYKKSPPDYDAAVATRR